jgi:hypothetical protein
MLENGIIAQDWSTFGTVCKLLQTVLPVCPVSSHFQIKPIYQRFYCYLGSLLMNQSALSENDAVPVRAYALAQPSA